jgi:hypothetical protein
LLLLLLPGLLLLCGPLVGCLLPFRCVSFPKPVGAGEHIGGLFLDAVVADA